MKYFQLLQRKLISSIMQSLFFKYNFQFFINVEISKQGFNKQTRDYNGEIKQKPIRQIQAHSRLFWHIQTYSEIVQSYSGILRTLCNPSLFRTLVYSKTDKKSEAEAYSEPCETSTVECFCKTVNSYSCFRKLKLSLQHQLFICTTF